MTRSRLAARAGTARAGAFIALGVSFERPITSSQMLWDILLRAE